MEATTVLVVVVVVAVVAVLVRANCPVAVRFARVHHLLRLQRRTTQFSPALLQSVNFDRVFFRRLRFIIARFADALACDGPADKIWPSWVIATRLPDVLMNENGSCVVR